MMKELFQSRKPRLTAVGTRCTDHPTLLYPPKLAVDQSAYFSCRLKATGYFVRIILVGAATVWYWHKYQ
jgi:hypothetical protein